MIKLIANNLVKSFANRKVVNKVSLEVSEGEVVGLLGPNGAGKTTTFYMIVGLIKADKGNILLVEKEITDIPINERAKLGIGYLPQEASVFRELTVRDNIMATLECRNISTVKRKDLYSKLIKDFGIKRIEFSKGRELSGGERRRVEIARTLALEPKFFLLDEPFAGVDPLAVSEIQEIIRELKRKNIGVLITDHSVRETLGIVDRAYIMNEGLLLTSGTPENIVNDEKAKKFYLGKEFNM